MQGQKVVLNSDVERACDQVASSIQHDISAMSCDDGTDWGDIGLRESVYKLASAIIAQVSEEMKNGS